MQRCCWCDLASYADALGQRPHQQHCCMCGQRRPHIWQAALPAYSLSTTCMRSPPSNGKLEYDVVLACSSAAGVVLVLQAGFGTETTPTSPLHVRTMPSQHMAGCPRSSATAPYACVGSPFGGGEVLSAHACHGHFWRDGCSSADGVMMFMVSASASLSEGDTINIITPPALLHACQAHPSLLIEARP